MHQQPPSPPPGCPMHTPDGAVAQHAPMGTVNALNNMPDLAQAPSPGQKQYLPLERTVSSIPRAPSSTSSASACPVASSSAGPITAGTQATQQAKTDQWEYPSPQQFYNALVRKGWETPEESVEMMVNIHNWINEEAWAQVRRWEEKHPGGDRSMLASFQGRPQELSPKARYHLMMAKLFPNYYAGIRPFDRHDWTIHRPVPAGSGGSSYMSGGATMPFTAHRYVIDYYHLPNDEDGNPVFSLDVRPAVDDFGAVQERVSEWWKLKKETWFGAGQSSNLPPGVKFPGRQKIIISKKWGFTNLSREEYLEKRSIAQPDGAYVQFVKPHGPLEDNLRRLERIGA
ncbi:holocytochrome c synthase [Rhodotorula toruloides]